MIQLNNVSYTYPNTTKKVLKNVNLTINPGECIVVTGQAGAGKTTLCLAAAGILHHEFSGGTLEGTVTIDGRNVRGYRDMSDLGSRIGMVFDDSDAQLIFTTVEEEILSGLEHLGLQPDKIAERLERVMNVTKINHLRDRAPHTLSGGQKQRAVIAVTLALGTDILILDEPLSELDAKATEIILDILSDLKKEGKTILIAEHKIDRIARIADTIVLLKDGEIVRLGSPEQMIDDPHFHDTVKEKPGLQLFQQPVKPITRAGSSGPPVIIVKNCVHRYGQILALHNIDLEILPGECLAIIGDNGSGKTTLIKHFNGLLHPTEGSIIVKGKDTAHATVTELARDVGLVFQNPDTMLFAETVWQEVAFGINNLGIPNQDETIRRALKQVNLSHTWDLYPRYLSRGERQRLAVACIIAMQPSIIILDEPTTGLDNRESCEVMDILKEFQKQGHTIVIVTHSMEIVYEYADRVIVMEHGKIISDKKGGI